MDREAIYKILTKKYPTATIWLLDRKYAIVEYEELMDTIRKVMESKWKYVKEFSDCEDAAFRLLGLLSIGDWAGIAFGFAFKEKHAFNIAVVEKDNLIEAIAIEPQYRKVYDYKPTFILM